MSFHIHTDLALEETEQVPRAEYPKGIQVKEKHLTHKKIHITHIRIEHEEGSALLGKPLGSYITLEAERLPENDGGFHEEISDCLAEELASLFQKVLPPSPKSQKVKTILAVGLGNPDVTPDALGPLVLEHLTMNRHLSSQNSPLLCGIVPRVMAQTGMETVEIIQGLVHQIHPDLVLVIDALAARSTSRLGKTIQLTDTGIYPGSGVGNHRHAITQDTIRVPVIAIGVPTVVSTPAIVTDALHGLFPFLEKESKENSILGLLSQMNPDEQYQTILGLLNPDLGQLFVTPKDIDETIRRISYTISEGIHRSLNRGKLFS